jgi:hypothetical protein
MKILLVMLLIPLLIIPAFAESQTLRTDKGALDVNLSYDDIEPNVQTKINIDFINPVTKKTQVHIDYTITVTKDGQQVFGPIPLTHTSVGTVRIPIEFNQGEGVYKMDFKIEGILFQPLPTETVSFDIVVGDAQSTPNNDIPPTEENGGCLIATATYGSEMAPQVQQLREIRDNTLFSTTSGTSFMMGFNTLYYSFAPTVADWERENPMFKETVKTMITPMLSTLSIMSLADEGSEAEVLGFGISVIALNLGMYIAAPALIGFKVNKIIKSRK